ncbi:pilin N-terminal domain-containing protein, partial [Pseudolactococcus yaeyamensis]
KKSLTTLAIASSFMGAFFITPKVLGTFEPTVVHAADSTQTAVPDSVNVIVHKLMYDKNTALDVDKNGIVNDGHEKTTYPGGVTAYDKSKYGRVGFTVYDISNAFADNDYKDSKISGIVSDIEAKGTNSDYIKKATSDSGEKIVDAAGNITFGNMPARDNGDYKVYAVVETKTPKGMITQKAKPAVIVTPMTTNNGADYLKDINIYPKNITQKLIFTFTKVGDDGNKNGAINPLVGAKFQLYKGIPGTSNAVKVGSVLTTNAAGQVVAVDLLLGDFFWVELPSPNVDDPADKTGHSSKYLLGADAKNNADNKLRFSIGEDGVDPSGLKCRYVNFKQPDIKKDLINGTDSNKDGKKSFETGDATHHQAVVHIPNDIAGNPDGININGTKYQTKPYSTFIVRDRPQKGLLHVESKGNIVMKDNAGKTLKLGVDYTVATAKDKSGAIIGWDINYLVGGKVSSAVAALSGTDVTIDYDLILTQDAIVSSDIINDIYLDYGTDTDVKTLHDDDVLYTYGAKFVKESSGLFGTGVGNKKVAGAEFILQNKDGKYFTGKKDNDKDTVTENVWSAKLSEALIYKTNSAGEFEVLGLVEGDYQIVETKAPDNYQKLQEPIKFTVEPDSYKTILHVKNDEKPTAPLTGSTKTLLFVIVFTVVAAGAGVIVYKKRMA